ncbi:MAG: hypothetical protein SXV54_15005 [Chloroflexota bacterium]|nr:hypothetical protein [Chloroflexota bacterium]
MERLVARARVVVRPAAQVSSRPERARAIELSAARCHVPAIALDHV